MSFGPWQPLAQCMQHSLIVSAGDLRGDGEDREGLLHPGASAAVPGPQGLHQVLYQRYRVIEHLVNSSA
jgi:hypothetical protein